MADYLIKGETLTNIADAIRSKTGSTEDIKAKDMASTIETISTGTDTSDATATADEIFAGETAYTADGKVTGTFTINEEVAEQESLIQNIKTALEGKASATVRLQNKTITENGTYTADSGYDGLGNVTVEVEGSGGTSVPLSNVTISAEGTLAGIYITFLNGNMDCYSLAIDKGYPETLPIVTNSLLVIKDPVASVNFSNSLRDGCRLLYDCGPIAVFSITDSVAHLYL